MNIFMKRCLSSLTVFKIKRQGCRKILKMAERDWQQNTASRELKSRHHKTTCWWEKKISGNQEGADSETRNYKEAEETWYR